MHGKLLLDRFWEGRGRRKAGMAAGVPVCCILPSDIAGSHPRRIANLRNLEIGGITTGDLRLLSRLIDLPKRRITFGASA